MTGTGLDKQQISMSFRREYIALYAKSQ